MKLSKLKNLLKPKKLFGTLIVLAVIYLLFTNFKGVFEGFGTETGKPTKMLLLHMDGCGHCKTLMPKWDEFVRNTNNSALTTESVEMNADPERVKKYKVSGFPTILLLDENDKKIETYEGERTASGLKKYYDSKIGVSTS